MIPIQTSVENGLKKRRIELLTHKVQPNFAKAFAKLDVLVESVTTDETTLDSYFVIRFNPKAKPDDSLLLEIKNKIFSTGRFLITGIGPYSFKVSIALTNLEEGFKFTPLNIAQDEPVTVKAQPAVAQINSEPQNKIEPKISNNQIQTQMGKNADLKEKVKNFVQSSGLKGGTDYSNILLSTDESYCVVNCKKTESAEKLFRKRGDFGKQGLVTMKPGAKAVRFYSTLPAEKSKGKLKVQNKSEDGAQRQTKMVSKSSSSKKVLSPERSGGFKSVPDALQYLSNCFSEMSSNSLEKVWENIEEKHGAEFELLVRVRSKGIEQMTVISKKDFLLFAK